MNLKSHVSIHILFISFLILTSLLLAPTLQAKKQPAEEGLPLEKFFADKDRLNLSSEEVRGSIDSTACEYITWDTRFSPLGVDGRIRALAWDGNNLYVGGQFVIAESVVVNNIAKWDGKRWSDIGDGTDGEVHALAWDGSNLYVGGSFSTAGGNIVNNIAKWDGNNWSDIGGGTDSIVRALAWDGNNLYAGGSFSTAGGNIVNSIARWDGNSWLALGSGMDHFSSFETATVYALAWDGSNLYAGGNFTKAGEGDAHRIAKWDGSIWADLDGGVDDYIDWATDPYSYVLSLAWDGNNLYVGGSFFSAGGIPYTKDIARWDGSSWSALGSGIGESTIFDDTVYALEWDGYNLYIGGDFNVAGGISANNIAKWDGSSWSVIDNDLDGSVLALVRGGGNLYASEYDRFGADHIAKWDSNSWSYINSNDNAGNGIDDFNAYAFTWDGSHLYAGGNFTKVGGNVVNYIARWDGNNWSTMGGGVNEFVIFDPVVYALAWDGSNLYAGGFFSTAGGISAPNIAKWDGNSWSNIGGGIGGEVHALTWDGSNLYAGGYGNKVAKWDGNVWSDIGSGLDGAVYALVWDGIHLYAGGDFTLAGDTSSNNIARWDGSVWSGLGSGLDGPVYALVWDGIHLYAGGDFTLAGGTRSNNIARWDGNDWTALGSGTDDIVRTLARYGSHIYVGGDFTFAGGISSNYIARWDGNNWTALGNGTDDSVRTLVWDGSGLYVGGDFKVAGFRPSHKIGRWGQPAACNYLPMIPIP
jgi:hypothetical protein